MLAVFLTFVQRIVHPGKQQISGYGHINHVHQTIVLPFLCLFPPPKHVHLLSISVYCAFYAQWHLQNASQHCGPFPYRQRRSYSSDTLTDLIPDLIPAAGNYYQDEYECT